MYLESLRSRPAAGTLPLPGTLKWSEWQEGVVRALQIELHDVAPTISQADVDWPAWRSLLEAGYRPYAAVLRALERDF